MNIIKQVLIIQPGKV